MTKVVSDDEPPDQVAIPGKKREETKSGGSMPSHAERLA